MEKMFQDFGTKLGQAITTNDFDAAHALLAPWLQRQMTPSDLADRLAVPSGVPQPTRFSLDANRSTYEQLRNPEGFPPRSEPFHPELTADNFRLWMCIELMPAEDSEWDACYDLWLAAVDVNGRLAVGYLEPSEAD